MLPRKVNDPTVQVRLEEFNLLNAMIRDIQELYNETPSEKAMRLLTTAKQLKEIWWSKEDSYRQHEYLELLRNLREYPFSVRIAAVDENLQ